jgi:lysophospholipase L1-like esterase
MAIRLLCVMLLCSSTMCAQFAYTPVLNGQTPTIFVGDSITRGWTLPFYFGPDVPYMNQGVSGDTANDCYRRWETAVYAMRAGTVVWMCGMNDVISQYSLDLAEAPTREFFEQSQNYNLNIVVLSITPTRSTAAPGSLQRRLDYNAWLKNYVETSDYGHIIFVDLDLVLAGADGYIADPAWMIDSIHPNSTAYQKMT